MSAELCCNRGVSRLRFVDCVAATQEKEVAPKKRKDDLEEPVDRQAKKKSRSKKALATKPTLALDQVCVASK